MKSYSSLAYTGWIGPWDRRLSANYQVFRKVSELGAMPQGLYSFIDVNPDSICWPYFGMHMDRDSFYNYPNASHKGGGVVAFADAHASYHRWQDRRTTTPGDLPGDNHEPYHYHDSASAHNPDLAWLRQRASYLSAPSENN
jgi:hypothetical protein